MNFKKTHWSLIIAGALLVVTVAGAWAQFRGGGGGRRRFGGGPIDRGNTPTWTVNDRFRHDTFSFARLKYRSSQYERSSYAWWTDYPDADVNLSYRLHELTSLNVQPEPKILELSDPELFDYPWLFMSGAGNIILDEDEVKNLRTYLESGGFLMVDDFWGQAEWDGVYRALKKVLPNCTVEDLPRTDPLFHCVFDLPNNLSLQTCNIGSAMANRDTGVTWEDNHEGGNTRDIHIRAIFDDHRRMMVLLCHNTDNGDGWEEEGSDPWFFSTYSEKRSYPFGINMLVYAMTH